MVKIGSRWSQECVSVNRDIAYIEFLGGTFTGGWVGGGWVSENGNNAISASMEVEVELSCVEAEAKGKKYGL